MVGFARAAREHVDVHPQPAEREEQQGEARGERDDDADRAELLARMEVVEEAEVPVAAGELRPFSRFPAIEVREAGAFGRPDQAPVLERLQIVGEVDPKKVSNEDIGLMMTGGHK